MSFDQSFVDLVTEEFSTPFEPGNGYYVTGEAKVEWGWKVFRAGMSQADSFVPFVFGDGESVAAAKIALVDRVVGMGGTAKGKEAPKQCVRVTISKSSVLDTLGDGTSKAANWKEDRTYDVNTHAQVKEGDSWRTVQNKQYKEVLLPSVDQFLTTNDLGEWLWLAIGLRGEDYVTATGEKKTRFTPFIMNRFANEAEARLAVDSGDPSTYYGVGQPDGWDDGKFGAWVDTLAYVKEELSTSLAADAPVPVVNKKIAELVASYNPSADDEKAMLTNAFLKVFDLRKSNVPF